MEELDVIGIAVAPPEVLETSLVEKVAAMFNKDLYTTRLQLSGKIPRIIARCRTTEEAQAIVQSLNALGVVAFMYKDSERHSPSGGRFRAHSLKREEGKITFRDDRGAERNMQTENAFLILQGTMQTCIEKEITNTKMKLNVPMTLLTGGIPVMRRVKEKTRDVTVQNVRFIRLYERLSMEPAIEILQYDFDYSFLGQKMTSSSLTNLGATAGKLRDTFPRAAFDDRLLKSFAAGMPSASPQDGTEVNCRLIYLYYQAISNPV